MKFLIDKYVHSTSDTLLLAASVIAGSALGPLVSLAASKLEASLLTYFLISGVMVLIIFIYFTVNRGAQFRSTVKFIADLSLGAWTAVGILNVIVASASVDKSSTYNIIENIPVMIRAFALPSLYFIVIIKTAIVIVEFLWPAREAE